MASNVKGMTRLIKACGYSWAGLRAAWRHEAAFRQEVLLLIVLGPAALWLGQTAMERLLLLGSGLLLLVVELLNSAVEAVTDRVGIEPHELSARAKDLGSAAVMLSLLLVAVVWATLLWQRCGSG